MTQAAVALRGLKIEGLCAGYRGANVVHDVTLSDIKPGEFIALVGPNAAGKSTLLRALAGLTSSRGRASLGNLDLVRAGRGERARQVAFMPQTLPAIAGITVLEGVVVALRASPVDAVAWSRTEIERRAVEILRLVGIDDLALKPLDQLSGGQRQLASLAQAAVRRPALMLLDEPTSALDIGHQLRVMNLVRQLARDWSVTVFAVLHDLALACRWADRIAIMDQGRIVAFGPPDVAVTSATLGNVYGVRATVERTQAGHMVVTVEALSDEARLRTCQADPT